MNNSYKKQLDLLIVLIIYFIAFQKFPIIRLGGIFKLYELLALLILILTIVNIKFRINVKDIPILIFFVFSPVLGLANFYLHGELINNFFLKYPGIRGSLKFTPAVFPIFTLVFMFFHAAVYFGIKHSKSIKYSFENVIRVFLCINTVIAVYSLFAVYFLDVIAYLPALIQDLRFYGFRTKGLSQEPSFYIIIQSWVVYILLIKKDIFKPVVQNTFLIINLISLLHTFSSSLVVVFLGCSIYYLFLHRSRIVKLRFLLFIIAVFVIANVLIAYTGMYDYVKYAFVDKIGNYFNATTHTLDSGSFRSYTTRIGFEIFRMFPVTGCGVGNSQYFMYLFEYKMGIKVWGERLHLGSFPQNLYSSISAEQGILGIFGLVWFVVNYFKRLLNNRCYNEWRNVFLVGGFTNLIIFNSVGPVNSLFLWLFLFLGYTINFDKKRSE